MKKVLTGSVIVLMVLLLSAGLGLAGNGKGAGQGGGGQGGYCGGTGVSIVCSGTPVDVNGIVFDVSYAGSGLQVTTEDGDVTVYGIGPYRYWDSLEIDRPAVGDEVAISGMIVDFNGTERIVAMSITIIVDDQEDQVVPLREECVDDVGGRPLWRGGLQN